MAEDEQMTVEIQLKELELAERAADEAERQSRFERRLKLVELKERRTDRDLKRHEIDSSGGTGIRFTSAQATVAAAALAVVSAIVGGLIQSSATKDVEAERSAAQLEVEKLRAQASIDLEIQKQLASESLERAEFETTLILKAIEAPSREAQIRNLKFFLNAGFISDAEGKIAAMDEADFPSLPPPSGSNPEDAFELIAQFERFYPEPYLDPAGVLTIGYGYVLTEEERASGKIKLGDAEISFSSGLSQADALQILAFEIEEIGTEIDELVEVPLSESQKSALVSFVFDVGIARFTKSTLLQRLNDGEYEAVATELGRWVRSGGATLPGLVRRREAEADIWRRPN